jgi:hypothetical protein
MLLLPHSGAFQGRLRRAPGDTARFHRSARVGATCREDTMAQATSAEEGERDGEGGRGRVVGARLSVMGELPAGVAFQDYELASAPELPNCSIVLVEAG